MTDLVMTIPDDMEIEEESSDSEFEMKHKRSNNTESFEFANTGFSSKGNKEYSPAVRRMALNQKIQNRLAFKERFAARKAQMKALARERGLEVAEDEENEEESDDDHEDDSSDDSEHEKPTKNGKKSAKKSSKKIKSTPKEVTVEFSDLKLSRPLLRAIDELGYKQPTPVQARAIPMALAGKDLLVNAMTGSGKTAAFMLPVLERLLYRPVAAQTRVLVLEPTRELAQQVYEVTSNLAKYSDVTATLLVGGLSVSDQATSLRARPDIVVATPGRLIDHLHNTQSFEIESLEVIILDEADRLLESGFRDELEEIVRLCPRGRQSMLFSATLTKEVGTANTKSQRIPSTAVEVLSSLALNNPQTISCSSANALVDNLAQEFIRLRNSGGKGKEDQVERRREGIILSLCTRTFKKKVIIFVKSKIVCHRLVLLMGLTKLKAAELHGNLTQAQRLEALEAFRNGEVNFLCCTDLASRGLDIRGVDTVINMHLPRELRQYVHRVGRTARAGRSGRSVSIVGDADRKLLREVVKKAKDVVQSRQMVDNIVQKYMKKVQELEEDIEEILREEAEEKKIRLADMEATKATNMLLHRDEIAARPARDWFQTPKQRESARNSAVRTFQNPEDKKEEVIEKPKKPKTKEQQLRGLSRKEKRKKMMRWEDEEYYEGLRQQKKAEAEQDTEASPNLGVVDLKGPAKPKAPKGAPTQSGGGAVLGKIAKSKARKELNDKKLGFEPSDRLSGQKRKRNQKVRKSYTHEETQKASRFEQNSKSAKREAENNKPRKVKPKSQKGSFKSLKKHKRR